MKKFIVTFCILAMTAVTAFAQSDNNDREASYTIQRFSQGWFVDLAGTYSIFASTGSSYSLPSTYYGGFNKTNPRQLFGLSAKFGRRVSPSTALRIGYDWHPSYNADSYFNFKSLHFDVMESPLDLFLGYKPDRLYTMWLYGGVGLLACDKFPAGETNTGNYRYLIHFDSALELGVHGGIMNNFRLSNSLDLHIDLQAVATKWSYDSDHADPGRWHRAHFDFSAMAGIMWYLAGRRFDVAETAKIIEADFTEKDNQIQSLQGEVKQLQSTINELSNNVPSTKPCDTIVKFVNVDGKMMSYPFSIFFNKGSYELRDGRDRVNLQEIANVAKKNGYKINLRGSCDSATGSSSVNKTLAENRCRKIKDELVKMGVNEKDIILNEVGGVQELTPAEYDRRVLINLVME